MMSEHIGPDDLRQQQASKHAPIVIDVRTAEEYAAGHLPGAIHLPAGEVRERRGEFPTERPVVPY
jgi:rhodanese-related sulfurtransferase